MLRVLQCGGGSGHRSFREALHPHRTTVSMLRYETSFVFLLVPVPLLYNLQCRVPVVPVPVPGPVPVPVPVVPYGTTMLYRK